MENYENITLIELKSANSLLSLLEESKEYILSENPEKCPVCQNIIKSEEIIGDLSPKIDKINEDLKLFKNWKRDCDNLIKSLSNLDYDIRDFNSENPKKFLDYDLNDLCDSLIALSNFNKKLSEMDKEILYSLNEDISSIKSEIQTNSEEINQNLDNILILKEIIENKKELEKIDSQYEVSKKSYELFKEIKKEELGNILNLSCCVIV